MAESVKLPATGTGTADILVAVDTIGGEQYQRVKIAMGIDGTFDKDVSATDPLPITAASGKIASGAIASGAIASGAVASGAVASGAVVDGAVVTLGAKADDKSTATDTTAISLMSVAKEVSFISQAINTKLATGTVIGDVNLGATDNAVLDGLETHLHSIDGKMVTGTDIGDVTINNAAGAAGVNIQDGGNAITVDGTVAVTNAGTFAVQVDGSALTALQLIDNAVSGAGFNITQVNGESIDVGAGTEAAAIRVTLPTDGTGKVTAVSGTAANMKVEATIAATQTLSTVTTVGTVTAVTTCNLAAETTKVIGTVRVASGGIASGGIASGAIASGAIASGAIASGAVASGAIATGAIVDALADDSALSVATSRVFPMGAFADEASTDSVDEGDVGCPRMSLTRQLIVTERPSATGESLDIVSNIDIDESEDDIKASAGKIYGYYIYNNATTTRYLRFYNATAANTTVGTTAAFMTLPIPAGAAANQSYEQGIGFSTALCWAATTGVAANDTGAPAASDVVGNVFYK
jgi:hypothetical protein